MRRKDREVTGRTAIRKVLELAKVMRVAFIDNDEVYLVPVNYGYEYGDSLVLYFHGAMAGRKYELLLSNPKVTIELDAEHELYDNEIPSEISYFYSSVMGTGRAEILSDNEDMITAMKLILKQQTGRDFEIEAKQLEGTMVARVVLDQISCKRHRKG